MVEILLLTMAAAAVNSPPKSDPGEGKLIFGRRCANCHRNTTADRTPSQSALARWSSEELAAAMKSGSMKAEAAGLSGVQVQAVASFLTGIGRVKSPAAAGQAACVDNGGPLEIYSSPTSPWNGWGRDLDNSRYQPKPNLTAGDIPRLKPHWVFGYHGAMTYGQPSVVGGRVFVGDQTGHVYSLDARTGCAHWTADVGAGVHTAIMVVSPRGGANRPAIIFGDDQAFVHAVDALTGESIWRTRADEHPFAHITGTPVEYEGRIYVPVSSSEEIAGARPDYSCCTFRGSVAALDSATGSLLWKSYPIETPPGPIPNRSRDKPAYGPAGGAVWSAPTIDSKRRLVYVTTGNSYTEVESRGTDAVVAIDLTSGSIRWIHQMTPSDNFLVGCLFSSGPNCPKPEGSDFDFGSSPILRTLPGGGQVLLVGQKSGFVYALDVDAGGKTLWERKVGEGSALGGIEWGPAADEENVYVAVSDALSGPLHKPGITALHIATGERVWNVPTPAAICHWGTAACFQAQSGAVTTIPHAVVSGSLDGPLRAYSTETGKVTWDYNTAKSYRTVNGVNAVGGSLDGSGPVIADGAVYVNSGYGRLLGQPGNALIAFTVDGR